MKKSYFLVPLIGLFTWLSLTSSSGGYSSNRTGSHGGSLGCGSCHGSSATTGVSILFELDSAGVPVTKYVGGMNYTLKMTGTNTTANSCPRFGFELSAVSGTGTTSAQAGTFTGVVSPYRSRTSSSITYVEQSTPIAASSGTGGSGTTYTVSVGWTAPAAGTGTVSVFGVLNAVDGTGGTGGDYWNTASTTFTEETGVSTEVSSVSVAETKVYPNPFVNTLHIAGTGDCGISVYDINGKAIVELHSNGNAALNTGSWPTGMYQVVILQDGKQTAKTIVKY